MISILARLAHKDACEWEGGGKVPCATPLSAVPFNQNTQLFLVFNPNPG